jgi:hypothetical protein
MLSPCELDPNYAGRRVLAELGFLRYKLGIRL